MKYKLLTIIIATFQLLLSNSMQATLTLPTIPVEGFADHVKRLGEITTDNERYATLSYHNVRFLPGDCIGGMSRPFIEAEDLFTISTDVDHELIQTLHDHFDVTTIVTLTEEPLPEEIADHYPSIKFIHLPTQETSADNFLITLKAILPLALASSKQEKLIIHCFQGLGRTGTILAAILYLMTSCSMNQAISYIRTIRPEAIDRPEQEAFLRSLEVSTGDLRGHSRVEYFFAMNP